MTRLASVQRLTPRPQRQIVIAAPWENRDAADGRRAVLSQERRSRRRSFRTATLVRGALERTLRELRFSVPRRRNGVQSITERVFPEQRGFDLRWLFGVGCDGSR